MRRGGRRKEAIDKRDGEMKGRGQGREEVERTR